MKLLLDENLSPKLRQVLDAAFPDTQHVRDLGLKRSPDSDIWRFAAEHDYAIVSKDADFHQRSLVFGFPPKVIGIFAGNCPTIVIERMLLGKKDIIIEFLEDEAASFLPLMP